MKRSYDAFGIRFSILDPHPIFTTTIGKKKQEQVLSTSAEKKRLLIVGSASSWFQLTVRRVLMKYFAIVKFYNRKQQSKLVIRVSSDIYEDCVQYFTLLFCGKL
mmetsp:Transcript_70314/g.146506  ORF Transcript_70314/g.146506 Transcript_70314/m.146506 type:complete len:104 (+) Transcript_70314:126-437(+)